MLNTKNFVLCLVACIVIAKANGAVLLGVAGGAISSSTCFITRTFDSEVFISSTHTHTQLRPNT